MENKFLSAIIPAEKLEAVDKALVATFGDKDLSDITSIKGGLSGSLVFKIALDNQSYILKVNKDKSQVSDSFNAIEIASQYGVAPKLFYINKFEGISITRFINHVPLRAVYTSPEILLPNLADTIRQIHQMPLFEKENSLFKTIDRLVTEFQKSGMLAGPVIEECFNYYDVIKKHYPWQTNDNVSSHNDLNPSNITCDGDRIWVIDWDMASQNDRFVDLATSANFFVHTDEEENIFLKSYFQSPPDSYQSARFFLMRQTCRIVYGILMFNLADKLLQPGENHDSNMEVPDLREIGEQMRAGTIQLSSYEGQMIYGKAMINEALKNMRLPRFQSSIDRLK